MNWSSKLFVEQVWPEITACVGGGELIQMEGRPDTELASRLDMLSGIDGWQIHNSGIRGVASRIQKGDRSWDTFTVRMSRSSGAETEYAKRKRAIESSGGWIYPHLTIQAYSKTETGPVMSIGVARTEDIIAFIDCGFHRMNSTTNASFAVCSWSEMDSKGFKIKRITPTKKGRQLV